MAKKMTLERLQREARFLSISLPYDSREECCLLEFSNSEDGGLEKKDNYAIPMLDRKEFLFNLEIDLKERRVANWKTKNGYWRIWGKVKHYGTYTLLDSNRQPLWQIHGFVPCKLSGSDGFNDYPPRPYDPESAEFARAMSKLDGSWSGADLTIDYSAFH